MSERVTIGLFAAAAVACLLSLSVGPAHLPGAAILSALLGKADPATQLIVWQLRLPRTVLALAIGATLGLAGAATQGYARNPLASPDVLGIPAFASLGAVAAIYFGYGGPLSIAVPITAIVSAFGGTALLFLLAGRESGPLLFLLAGLVLSSLAGALTSLLLSLAPSPFAVTEIAFWLLGSLADRSATHVALALPFMVVSWIIALKLTPALRLLTLGEETAVSLGLSLLSTRLLLGACVACGVGAGVAVAGGIGFVGLVVPHLVRPYYGYDPGRILVPSAAGGAALLTFADVLVRVVPANGELKTGVVTSLVGVPFFLYLLLHLRVRGALSGVQA